MAPWRNVCVGKERENTLKPSLESAVCVALVKGMPIVFVLAPVGSPTSCRAVAWAGTDVLTNRNREHW